MNGSIYVTGIGVVSPAGGDTQAHWQALIGGRRCVKLIEKPELAGGGALPVGSVGEFQPPRGTEDLDRVCQLAVLAADQAAAQADLRGLSWRPVDPRRLAVSFGTSKGGIISFGRAVQLLSGHGHLFLECGATRKSPDPPIPPIKNYFSQEVISGAQPLEGGLQKYLCSPVEASEYLLKLLSAIPADAPARLLASRLGARAAAHASVAACSTGTLAIIRGAQMIADGQADVVLAGSADASLHPLWFAAFERMGVLAEAHQTLGPGWACRPFDADRRGFVVGEGAAALVLESAQSLRRRGAEPLARLAGYAMGTDPAGLTGLQEDGTPLGRIAETACRRAGIQPSDLAAIQAHGTGTLSNDQVEINAIRRLCGPKAGDIPIVSLKGSLGHLLGAAGAVELATAVLAVSRRALPPNATLADPDPRLGSLTLPTEATQIPPGVILKTSMGFGGHLAAVVLLPA